MAYTQQTPIGTPDVNLITKTLAGLQPDSALQQYAMLHKNNPYILSLAKSESDRRKSLRTAAQGNPGQQPTVVDQNIAGMAQQQLPENQGIAQIPTPNMQRMADGGIAGYEDDEEGMATGGMGGMFNFAQQSEPVVRMSGGGAVPRYQFGGSLSGDFSGFGGPTPEQQVNDELRVAEQERIKKIAALEQKVAFLKSAGAPQAQEAETQLNALKADMRPKPSPTDPNFRRQTDPRITGTAAAPPTPENKKDTGGVKDLLPGAAKLDTSYKASKAPTIDDAKTLSDKFFNSGERIADIKRQVTQEQLDATNAQESSIAALKAFNEKQGPAYAGYEKLLQKEELQDATDKEKAGLMSLMKGFLAMAAGESPNAATNIAKGAMVGLGDYGDALKEFKKAAKERNKEMQNIQQARRAEERGDFKEERMYTDKADTARLAASRHGSDAVNRVTDAGAKASTDIYNTISTNKSRENVAAMGEAAQNLRTKATIEAQLNTPDRLVFNQLVKDNNNNPVAAAEALQKLKAEKFNVYEAYSKYLAAFANKEGVSPPDPFDVFAKRFIPTVTPSKNTTVRTQPGG